MSLIVALPCHQGAVLASDSRAVLGTGPSQQRVDLAPKVVVVGSFGMGMTGEMFQQGVFSLEAVPERYWASVGYQLTDETFRGFVAAIIDELKAHPPVIYAPVPGDEQPQGVAALACSVLAPDDVLIAGCRVLFDQLSAPVVMLKRFSPTSPFSVLALGAHANVSVPPRPVGEVPTLNALHFAAKVLASVAESNADVGGALATYLLRPPITPTERK